MRVSEILRFNGDAREAADSLAYPVLALIRVARLALENETGGDLAHREAYVSQVLEVAEALMGTVYEGVEELARETKRGFWRKEDAA